MAEPLHILLVCCWLLIRVICPFLQEEFTVSSQSFLALLMVSNRINCVQRICNFCGFQTRGTCVFSLIKETKSQEGREIM